MAFGQSLECPLLARSGHRLRPWRQSVAATACHHAQWQRGQPSVPRKPHDRRPARCAHIVDGRRRGTRHTFRTRHALGRNAWPRICI